MLCISCSPSASLLTHMSDWIPTTWPARYYSDPHFTGPEWLNRVLQVTQHIGGRFGKPTPKPSSELQGPFSVSKQPHLGITSPEPEPSPPTAEQKGGEVGGRRPRPISSRPQGLGQVSLCLLKSGGIPPTMWGCLGAYRRGGCPWRQNVWATLV